LIFGAAPPHRAAPAGGLTSTIRLSGQTAGATLAATLLALDLGAGPGPGIVAAALTLAAGVCAMLVLMLRPTAADISEELPLDRGRDEGADADIVQR
jgi:DHA2 family multidrug resistance protein-like MFS transporter